ncbi:MAG: DNA mismatch repair protein MutS [Rhodopila sp.]|nr:DNA mismatch repair protein MutS [Rhodopila sp.]
MTFHSILSPGAPDGVANERTDQPEFFVDLNLDQIVAGITAGKDEYNLTPFFYVSLHDIDSIRYRHEIMQDVENAGVAGSIRSFAARMHEMREHLARSEKLHYQRQKERWFLEAVDVYCAAVTGLVKDLSAAEVGSRGLLAFREYVTGYAASESFTALAQQTQKLAIVLSEVHYCVLINGSRVQVRKFEGERDYSLDVEATFERFKQGSVKAYDFSFRESPEMNHIEENILDLVAKVYPDVFSDIEIYSASNRNYMDAAVAVFDREIQFYVSYLEYIARFKRVWLSFCYPLIVRECKAVFSDRGFDLALAGKLLGEHATPVCNDFRLAGRERIIVVSGPNQGGKTTFARMFGQLHYLAGLGCPVPGTRAQLFLFDNLFTHFEREENMSNLRGKLQDDLIRIKQILDRATADSIIIMNEIFTSTALQDAIALSKSIASKLMDLDLLCVWVTFIDELASLGEQTVSIVSTVVPENPAQRTYEIVRRPADGLSYALSIAEKYRLTYTMIKERTGS